MTISIISSTLPGNFCIMRLQRKTRMTGRPMRVEACTRTIRSRLFFFGSETSGGVGDPTDISVFVPQKRRSSSTHLTFNTFARARISTLFRLETLCAISAANLWLLIIKTSKSFKLETTTAFSPLGIMCRVRALDP